MLGKSHLMMSLIAVAPLTMIATNDEMIYIIAFASLGALFPDIDEPESTIGRRLLGVSLLLSLFIKHRGITHTMTMIIVYLIIFTIVIYYNFNTSVIFSVIAFLLGNIVHVLGDMSTTSGVAILNPYSLKKYYILPQKMRIKTGNMVEKIIILPTLSADM